MRVALGSDHAGFNLKEQIRKHLEQTGMSFKDFGVFCENRIDYPDIAVAVSKAILAGEFNRGILICGTGIGMTIAANKHAGIRAALCGETYSARCARAHTDATVLAMGSRVIGSGLAADIVDVFLATPFDGGRHNRRIEKISLLE
ncbi:MAG TPA: ribose 5-phosphate isomerase B [Candidatus Limnocylindrales bacterium]|nr:ribose 5-phosphate isomerase B [Candidatus Limnocylindrales bacterium]